MNRIASVHATLNLSHRPRCGFNNHTNISTVFNHANVAAQQGDLRDVESSTSSYPSPRSMSELMEVDSRTSAQRSTYSTASSHATAASSPQGTWGYPYRLPPMENLTIAPARDQAESDNHLPPLRLLFPEMELRSVKDALNCDICSDLAFTIHSHEKIRSCRTRQRAHHSASPPPRFARQPQHRITRRGSYPTIVLHVPSYSARDNGYRYKQRDVMIDDDDETDDEGAHSPSPAPGSKPPHNNKSYDKEMIMWMRYFHVDLKVKFKAMLPLFYRQFPERWNPFAKEQSLSARFYRDCWRPARDEHGNLIFDAKGRPVTIPAKCRARATAEGKRLQFPYSLVEKWPSEVLKYEWTLEKDKERARQILSGNDPSDPQGKKAEWRRLLNECEHLVYKSED